MGEPDNPLTSTARILPSKLAVRFHFPRFAFIQRLLDGRPRALVAIIAVVAMAGFAAAGWLTWFSYDLTTGLPDRQALRGLGDMSEATTLFDVSDKPVFTIYKEQRIEVPLSKVSQNLIKAVVSVEDQRFFDHSGIDAVRIFGSVLKNVQAGRRAEGGSTITQQLARQSFLTRDKTYRRKLKEVILAAYIENLYNKEEILELYLNKVYFGDGLYGVEAASRGYFGRSASDLSVDQAALLAGLIQSPSSYAPTVNLDRAIARRNVVLQTMVTSGAIDEATAAKAKKATVKLTNALEINETFGLYFKEQVRRELVQKFGWQRVYQGGLKVYTTIQPEMQKAAEQLVEEGLADIEKRRGYKYLPRGKQEIPKDGRPDYLQGALYAMDPIDRLRRSDGRRARLQREPVQSRGPGQAAVGIGVQAVRLRDGDRGGLHAGYGHHQPRRADRDPAGRMGPRGRAFRRRLDDAAYGAADLEQPRRGAAPQQRRHQERGQLFGEAQRRHTAERAVAGVGGQRGYPRAADRGVRRVRQQGCGPRAAADSAGRGRRRQDPLPGCLQVAPGDLARRPPT